ncbi:MAG: AzlC family ABC transporter permease [Acidimicrobiales bacterium]
MAHEDAPDPPDEAALVRRARRDGVSLALAVGLVGVVFGVLARTSGLSVAKACAMSLLVFTGASQFTAVSIVAAGGSPFSALASALLLAARNTFYGPVAARWFEGDRLPRRLATAQVIIDESTGVGAAQPTNPSRRAGFLAAGIGTYVAWNLGTLVGAAAGNLVGDLERLGLDAAFAAVFVALLVPHVGNRPGRVAALVAGAAALAVTPVLPVGLPIVVSAVGAIAGAAVAERADLPGSDAPQSPGAPE